MLRGVVVPAALPDPLLFFLAMVVDFNWESATCRTAPMASAVFQMKVALDATDARREAFVGRRWEEAATDRPKNRRRKQASKQASKG